MPSPSAQEHKPDDLPGVQRLLSLSDGVVAIALTLLVLQLKVPTVSELTDPNSAGQLAAQLGKGGDQLTSYVISFYVIGQFWLAHHRVFRQIAGHDEGLAWWNFAFLFTITVMPFTSNILGEFSSNPLAVDIFAFNLLLASLATQATYVFGERRGLLVQHVDQDVMRTSRARSATIVVVIVFSMGIAWITPDVAKLCWILIAVAPRAATVWIRHRDSATTGGATT
jgi:uncharacterized membrane protein